MKTKTFFMTTILALAVMLLATAAPVHATTPEDGLVISADLQVGTDGSSASGTFTISSPLFETDSGTAYETFMVNWEDMTVHGVKTLYGAAGTIVIKFQGNITPGGVIGKFVIISGTGVYEKLHGVGDTFALMYNGTISATYSGTAHID